MAQSYGKFSETPKLFFENSSMVHVDKIEAVVEFQLRSVAQFHLITLSAVFNLHRLHAMLQIAAVFHKVHYLRTI